MEKTYSYDPGGGKQEWHIIKTMYTHNKRPAIVLQDPQNASDYIIATANLVDAPIGLDEAAIKEYDTVGLLVFLMSNHIVAPPYRHIRSGYVDFPICKVLI